MGEEGFKRFAEDSLTSGSVRRGRHSCGLHNDERTSDRRLSSPGGYAWNEGCLLAAARMSSAVTELCGCCSKRGRKEGRACGWRDVVSGARAWRAGVRSIRWYIRRMREKVWSGRSVRASADGQHTARRGASGGFKIHPRPLTHGARALGSPITALVCADWAARVPCERKRHRCARRAPSLRRPITQSGANHLGVRPPPAPECVRL